MICGYCGKTIKSNQDRIPVRKYSSKSVWLHKICYDKRYIRFGLKPPKRTTLKDFSPKLYEDMISKKQAKEGYKALGSPVKKEKCWGCNEIKKIVCDGLGLCADCMEVY